MREVNETAMGIRPSSSLGKKNKTLKYVKLAQLQQHSDGSTESSNSEHHNTIVTT